MSPPSSNPPSPASLHDLRKHHDSLVERLNGTATSSDKALLQEAYYSLRLSSSILLAILAQNDDSNEDVIGGLKRTARRCALLEEYLEQAPEEISLEVSCIDNQWTWRHVAFGSLSIVLNMSRTELAAEEATLLEMANTPVPQHPPQSLQKPHLFDRIQNEWREA